MAGILRGNKDSLYVFCSPREKGPLGDVFFWLKDAVMCDVLSIWTWDMKRLIGTYTLLEIQCPTKKDIYTVGNLLL